jgi:hypothetical protein
MRSCISVFRSTPVWTRQFPITHFRRSERSPVDSNLWNLLQGRGEIG